MTIGLALWSAMTAVSGLSRNGFQLAAARIGVGVGEASAGPAAYSLISDWFPRRRHLFRRRLLALPRRRDRRLVERRLSRRSAVRTGRLAGGVHGSRPART